MGLFSRFLVSELDRGKNGQYIFGVYNCGKNIRSEIRRRVPINGIDGNLYFELKR